MSWVGVGPEGVCKMFPLNLCCPKDGLDTGLIPGLQKGMEGRDCGSCWAGGGRDCRDSLSCWGDHTEEFTRKEP